MAAKIKIIKRNERTAPEAADSEAAAPKKPAQETARDMVATVSGWGNDFRQHRRGEFFHSLGVVLILLSRPAACVWLCARGGARALRVWRA